jgi:hypothetical protein
MTLCEADITTKNSSKFKNTTTILKLFEENSGSRRARDQVIFNHR